METKGTTQETTAGANQPEKYIRTFAGDIEALKKGDAPDLAHLATSTKSVAVAREAAFVAPPPLPQPSSQPLPPPQFPPPPPAPVKPPITTPLKTYANDFSDRMKETHASSATVLAAEQDSAREAPKLEAQRLSLGSALYVVGGIVLIIGASVGGYFAYAKYLSKTQKVVVLAPAVLVPIFVDDRKELAGTGPDLSEAISRSVAEPIRTGAVRLLSIETSTTTPESVFSALHLSAPSILLRNLQVSGSMAGVVNVGGNQSPFFILSVASYSETFSGMLQWESSLLREFTQLFPSYPSPTPMPTMTLATSTATSTPKTNTQKTKATENATSTATSTPPLPSPSLVFRDEIVANHDVRIYRDALGRSILIYGYWDQTTLVIARDPAAFSEILQRLATSRAQ